MIPEIHITLCDTQLELVEQWRAHFAANPEVEIRLDDLMNVEANAYVQSRMDGWRH